MKSFFARHRKARRSQRNLRFATGTSALAVRPRRLALETLENRLLLSNIFTVTNTSDSGPGSLRQAIIDANTTANVSGADTIDFNIAGSGSHTIRPLSALPIISDPVVIDGYTQPGASPNTNPTGSGLNTVLMVELDGSLVGVGHGLVITAGNSVVRGLAIHSFTDIGILIRTNGGNAIEGNFIATDVTGTQALGNATHGVQIFEGSQFNVIGTDGDGIGDAAERNLISGNLGYGVVIKNPGTDHNTVAGNLIGTDVTGTTDLGNAGGVLIMSGARLNLIGTDGDGVADAAERNVISANRRGVQIQHLGTDSNVVAGNYIGTDVSGTVALGNAVFGVVIEDGPKSNIIGTDGDGVFDAAERNVISGNGSGVRIAGAGSDDNTVAGNFIGTDVTGTIALGNGGRGVFVYQGAQSNRIGTNGDGTADDAERNVISGNALRGVQFHGAGTDHNVVAGNYIGTDATGTVPMGNGSVGVLINAGAQSNRIGTNGDGTADESERNIISGNTAYGIQIAGTKTDHNTVAGNYIGTDVTGKVALGNTYHGVLISTGAQSNRLGTNGDGLFDAAERNIISGNTRHGIQIDGSNTDHNIVAGNFIGTDVTGTAALGNGFQGVNIRFGARSNRIGTNGDGQADEAERNIISGNKGHGVGIQYLGSDYNVVAGNFIGTDVSGTLALGNGNIGVWIYLGAQHNLLGTDGDGLGDEAERNVISGNGDRGVLIGNPGTDHNTVAGNFIGTDVTGTIALGNATQGVLVYKGAQSNWIGTNGDGVADEAERNIISGNGLEGVRIEGLGTDYNVVAGNYVGIDHTGTVDLGNLSVGVRIGDGAKSNRIGTDGNDVADDAERNVISANKSDGVRISLSTINQAAENVVAGNFIGTDVTGKVALGNTSAGVRISTGAQSNRIGTDGDGVGDEAERNIISGNGASGISINNADNNVVAGNLIGTKVNGTDALGNGGAGITISGGAKSNRIGTNGDGLADESERNVISANDNNGIWIGHSGTDHNTVAGNFIGTDVTGNVALANASQGLAIHLSARHNLVGTDGDGIADVAERNVISGNALVGVWITADENVVAGNYIGTNATGKVALGNARVGVSITSGARSNRIGTNGDGVGDDLERNIISGNTRNGIQIDGSETDHNIVAGNFIGTDVTGSAALGNGFQGVNIRFGARSNRIGTNGDGQADEAERNVVSGNKGHGVGIQYLGSDYNVVAGNFIGTDVTGASALGNGGNGVHVYVSAQSNVVGTDGDGVADEAERNIISGNGGNGVFIGNTGTDNNVVAGNFIGTDVTGTIALSNGRNGVLIRDGAQFNVIGTDGDGLSDEAERNVISGNAGRGVHITAAGTAFNVVAGNFIGTDVTGTAALGNHVHGISIQSGAHSNRIGTNGDGVWDEAERNVISGNSRGAATYPYGSGVLIGNADTDHNVVAGNFIGTDATGMAALGNGYYGVWVLSGAKTNRIDRNTISANVQSGIAIKNSGTENNVVSGNFIGTDTAGIIALPNGGNGVQIYWGAKNNWIGSNGDGVADEAERNLISGNMLAGVAVFVDGSPSGNRIQGNSIHSNGGLGIDLGGHGVTPNDLGDTDAGPNGLQNYPEISLARPGATTQVAGNFNSTPNTTFTLDFYASSEADPSGYGEGERWLDSAVVTTDGAGNVSFDVVLAAATVSGEVITATATDPDGNTSEFSNADVLARVPIQIDVKPGSDSNPINLASQGVIAVVILTTDDFDAWQVDADTVMFAGAYAVHSALEDTDGDGDLDLVLHFRTQETNLADIYADLLAADIAPDDTLDSNRQEAAISLTGNTINDEFFEGFDELDLFLSGKNLRDLLKALAATEQS